MSFKKIIFRVIVGIAISLNVTIIKIVSVTAETSFTIQLCDYLHNGESYAGRVARRSDNVCPAVPYEYHDFSAPPFSVIEKMLGTVVANISPHNPDECTEAVEKSFINN